MAPFSFGAGNVAKLVRIPLYVLGHLATLVIPRARGRWVFGCGVGVADGALALWRVAAPQTRSSIWLTGSARDAAEADALGIPHVPAVSLRGFWATARARVIVVTHGFGDVNRYAVGGAFVVQLWHGIPLKRIGADSPATVRSSLLPDSRALRRLIGALYRATTSQIDLLPAASHLVRGRLESAFTLTDAQVPVTGEPRTDVLSRGDVSERRRAAAATLRAAIGDLPTPATRLVLYAPTWRDGAPDPAIPSPDQWSRLSRLLDEQDALLCIRSHPLGAGEYRPAVPSPRIRALGADVVRDVTPVLPAFDALVTDYSSLAFDAGLLGLPVVYLAPDVREYARDRGFYGRYEDVAGTDCARDWDETADQLRALLVDSAEWERRARRSAELSEKVHAYRDGRNAERVHRAILRREPLATTRPAAAERTP
ncbi:CDP-glycerol glycerophosphotransferase family protein [Microbacterium limosum]|uniref:CDP-glycerol glycerophosphotransferase family protein n=1 Tax=Microbacterium limosum TaxID=3079935 RepID=A0AAU0MEG9_9MICO|nr:CDP-glycerol glycerophosphotransferase family protein [Microbacterium sp. Y20]WOQ68604.1 CDP-glycerol glycerophosphotransferase family protein [Microbacterium sp. Y20]